MPSVAAEATAIRQILEQYMPGIGGSVTIEQIAAALAANTQPIALRGEVNSAASALELPGYAGDVLPILSVGSPDSPAVGIEVYSAGRAIAAYSDGGTALLVSAASSLGARILCQSPGSIGLSVEVGAGAGVQVVMSDELNDFAVAFIVSRTAGSGQPGTGIDSRWQIGALGGDGIAGSDRVRIISLIGGGDTAREFLVRYQGAQRRVFWVDGGGSSSGGATAMVIEVDGQMRRVFAGPEGSGPEGEGRALYIE